MISESSSKQGSSNTDFGVEKLLMNEINDIGKCEATARRKPGRPPKIHPPGTINGILAECAVCQDKATGLHYSVMTCEGCKGFFKRSIQAEKAYKCRNNNGCVINKETRNACQACRIRRCFEKGMKENLVRDDRTPGNRKKKYHDSPANKSIISSDNQTPQIYNSNLIELQSSIKQENQCIEELKDLSLDGYSFVCKKRFKNINQEYHKDIPTLEFQNFAAPNNSINTDMLSGNRTSPNDIDDWELSLLSDVLVDSNSSDAVQQMVTVYEQTRFTTDDGFSALINCSSNSDIQTKACKQEPKCLMHLLTKLVKAKPAEPAFCKYISKYPTSEEILECLADEIHLIIKFAKKTPGFCEQDMNRKLGIIHKYSLNILFIRMIYRSFSCHSNFIQLASNLCIGPQDISNIEILSPRFYQTMVQLICSFKSLNIDIYELCLIQYVVIEDEEGDLEVHDNSTFIHSLNNPKRNTSQNYLKIYTSTQYPDLPQRWILIMLCLSQIDEVSKLFMLDCVELIKANRLPISNEIMKELFSPYL